MKKRWSRFAAIILLPMFIAACSTQINTWSSRHYHELNTRYNVHFNGNEAYKQGLKQIDNSYKEDYSKLLSVYKVSDHNIAKSSASSMDRAIEKCQTAIKKHSIRTKPKKKANSKSKESYKRFYNKEEFNPFMDDVFLLMANAQFHKADFESASATCSYIMRHFISDKETYDKAAILMARAYTELEWTYEAENILINLNNENLTPSQTGAFSAAYADFLIQRKKYQEAIPYLKIALQKTNKKDEKNRWTFLLGQLYQETGKRAEANRIFGSIPGKNPPYEMEISARIRQTEVYPESNPSRPLKKLRKLSRSVKNKDYMDQIYYAMGNLYLITGDTTKAEENFYASLDTTKGGPHKLKTLLALGELEYGMENFIKAGPCFSDAEVLMNKEDERFQDVTFKAAALKVLVPELKIIHDEDSLQALANLPEKELGKIIDKMVKDAEKKAKEEEKRKNIEKTLGANQQMNEENQKDDATPNVPEMQDPTNKSWYFYNPSIVSKGITEFQKKWGKRALADDWRRNNKTAPFEQTETENQAVKNRKDSSITKTDTTSTERGIEYEEGSDDPLNPNYYLKNIPFSKDQLTVSNEKIAESLYKSGVSFREQMENDKLSLRYFRMLEERFPEDSLLEKVWYNTYLLLKQESRHAEADVDRAKLIKKFPESEYAKRLSDSLFIENLVEMYKIQDSIYSKAYSQFNNHKTDSLFSTGSYVMNKYPLCSLIPRIIFLEAIEYGRTGKPEDFHMSLQSIVEKYPNHELIPVVKEMLSYWDQGRRPVPSPGYISRLSLDSLNKDESKTLMDSLSSKLSYEPEEPHVLLIRYPADSTNTNRLLFDVALYNFTTFLIRDYDLSLAKVGKMDVLLVQGFENAEDVLRYRSWINFQNESPEIKYPGLRMIITSEKNMQLLIQGLDPDIYLDFYNKNYSGKKPEK